MYINRVVEKKTFPSTRFGREREREKCSFDEWNKLPSPNSNQIRISDAPVVVQLVGHHRVAVEQHISLSLGRVFQLFLFIPTSHVRNKRSLFPLPIGFGCWGTANVR